MNRIVLLSACSLIIALAAALADVPQQSPLRVEARVVATEAETVLLEALSPGRPVSPGMVMTVLDGQDAMAIVRIGSTRGARAQGTVIERLSGKALAPSMIAVAPCPMPITAVQGETAHVALPPGHRLAHGAVLRVVRDGRDVGTAALLLPERAPPAAAPTGSLAGPLRVGDVCYATYDTLEFPVPPSVDAASETEETADSPVPAEPLPPDGILVTSVSGTHVYFWTRSPDSLPPEVQRLSVVREGECVAVVRLVPEGPFGGQIEALASGVSLVPGDRARRWREGDAPGDRAAPELRPAAPPSELRAATDTSSAEMQAGQAAVTTPAVATASPDTAALASQPSEKPKHPWTTPPRGLSLSGPTGILRTPTAEVQPTGVFRIGRIHASSDLDRTFPGSRSRTQFTVGALPRTEVGGAHFGRFLEDITYHAKIQLLPEDSRWPAIAVGTMDERAAFDLDPTRFVAASKHFVDGRIRATLGYGHGGLDGVFAGIEAAVTPELTVLAEYDTEGVNLGLRAVPHPRIHIDLARLDGTLGGQATYAFVMDEEDAPPEPVFLSRPTTPADPQALAERLQDAICTLGMENVRTQVGETLGGRTAVVYYENRRHLHDETEALGRVLAAAVQELPPAIARLAVIVTKSRVPVLRLIVHPTDYERFLGGELSQDRFLSMLQIDHVGDSPIPRESVEGDTRLRNPTRFTADIALTPIVRALIGTERPSPANPNDTQTLSVRTSVRPDVFADLGRGLGLRYSRGIHIAGSLGEETDLYFAEDAAHVSYLFRPVDGVLGRVAAGDFLGGRRGGIVEGALAFGEDRYLLRGIAGRLSDRRFFGAGPYEWTYVGDIRYRVPSSDLTASLTFGRYIDDDAGFTVGLRKYFEDVELEMQFRHSRRGEVLLFGGVVPIGPRQSSRPDPVRIRLGDRFAQYQQALIPEGDTPGLVALASLVANELPGFDITDSILNRDRLNAAYIREHLPALLRAAHHVPLGPSSPQVADSN